MSIESGLDLASPEPAEDHPVELAGRSLELKAAERHAAHLRHLRAPDPHVVVKA
jgi:hypothetical protein